MQYNNGEILPSLLNQQIKIENEVGITLEYPPEDSDEEPPPATTSTCISIERDLENDENLEIELEDKRFVLDNYINNGGGIETEIVNGPESHALLNHSSENDSKSNIILLHSNLFTCNECEKTFTHKIGLWQHKKLHTVVRPLTTEENKMTLRKRKRSQRNVKPTYEVKQFKCDKCPKTFTHPIGLEYHKKCHIDVKPLLRRKCKRIVQEPKKSNNGVKPIKCNVCQKTFTHKIALWQHKKLHTRVSPYSTDENERKSDLREYKNVTTDIFICGICHRKFHFYPDFLQHKRRFHSIERPVKVEHSAEEKFNCDKCAKIFTNKSTLKHHKRQCYNRKKLLECDQCERKFIQMGHLTNHKRFHHRVKQTAGNERASASYSHDCKTENCKEENMFEQNDDSQIEFEDAMSVLGNDINDGNRIDTENTNFRECCVVLDRLPEKYCERNKKFACTVFACDKCAEIFTNENTFKYHKMRCFIRKRMLECDQCHRKFIKLSHLTNHKRFHHRVKPIADYEQASASHTQSHNQKTQNCKEQKMFIQNEENQDSRIEFEDAMSVVSNDINNGNRTNTENINLRECCVVLNRLPEKPNQKNQKTVFACDKCPRVFSRNCFLHLHKKSHDNGNQFECNKCTKTFAYYSGLWRHKQSHIEAKPLLREKYKKRVKEHKKSNIELKSNNCDKFPKTFGRPIALRQHKKRHTGIKSFNKAKSFTCDKCQKTFSHYQNWCVHKTTKVCIKQFSCKVCGKNGFTNLELKCHKITHNATVYNCEICQKNISTYCNLVRHIKNLHAVNNLFICKLCLKFFSSYQLLKEHSKVHDGEGNLKTNESAKRFNTKEMKCHMLEHGNEKKLVCGQCSERFETASTLERHKKRCYLKSKSLARRTFTRLVECKKQTRISSRVKRISCAQQTLANDNRIAIAENRKKAKSYTERDLNKRPQLEFKDSISLFSEDIDNGSETDTENINSESYATLSEKNVKKNQKVDFICDKCQRRFSSNYDLHLHSKSHDSVKQFSCNICQKTFTLNIGLLQHKKLHFEIEPLSNKQDKRTSLEYKKSHIIEKRACECYICRFVTKDMSDLLEHMFIHSGVKSFGCDQCPKRFSHNIYLWQHKKCHSATQSMLSSNENNRKVHSGVKSLGCDKWQETFRHHSGLSLHKQRHTGSHSNVKPFKCELCEKRFSCKQLLREHLGWHAGEKQFACDECSKRYKRKDHLKSHKITHKDEKPFACDECSKRYKREDHLKSHKITHKDEKPFACDECSKRYKRKDHLKTHKITHKDEKPFACDECPKQFTQNSNLKAHKFLHKNEKPFACDECPKQFARKGNLKAHKLLHKNKKTCPNWSKSNEKGL